MIESFFAALVILLIIAAFYAFGRWLKRKIDNYGEED